MILQHLKTQGTIIFIILIIMTILFFKIFAVKTKYTELHRRVSRLEALIEKK